MPWRRSSLIKVAEFSMYQIEFSIGTPEASMPKNAFFGPSITARRFYSFVSKDGDDEMFAPDLTDEQMKARIGHVQVNYLANA